MINLFNKKKNGTEITFKIMGMHCTSCAMNIDGELEDTKGVLSATTSYAKAITQIVYDPTTVSKQELKNSIQSLDYKAEEI